jgi:hypothetical protein
VSDNLSSQYIAKIIFSVFPRLSLESKKEELNSKLESLANQPFGDSPLFRTAFLVS